MTGNSHPHLYLTQNGIDRLKKIITGTHAELWREIREQADGLLTREPPEWRITAADTYDEQWWMSNNGPAMITLSLAWHMTGEEKYLDGARKWALATCDYPSWGTGWAANIDCMTGHNLYGLAVTYDWLYRDLDKNSLATIRQTLVKRASLVFDRAASGTIVPSKKDFSTRPWPEWEEVWLQNHLWVNATGLLATGLALIDETPAAEEWAAFAIDRFIRTMQYLGPDGASHEGINYWGYGVEHLLKSMYLMRDCADIDLFNGDWLRNAAFYRMHMSIPRNAWKINSISVNYGDSHPRDASGPDHILRALAAEFNDPHAQRFARLLDESNTVHASNRWLNLLWYDPAIPEKAIDEVPTFAHFSDQGIVTSRSGWAGDESFLFFKCGSYIGHHALEAMNYCASSAHHTHPDQNGFMLFADGEWLMRDDGNYGKYTGQHNTLIIDGGEQLGGGDSIFDGSRLHALKRAPKIITADSTPGYDHMAGDARAAYPPETGLTKSVRHLIHLKRDNALVIADDIVLDEARDLELRFHPGPQTAERDGNMFTAQTASGSTMRWEALATDDVAVSSYTHDLIDRRYNKSVMLAFSVKKHGKKMRNVAVVSWGKATTSGHKPAVTTSEDEFLISTDNARLKFDWNTGTITEK